MKRDAAKAHGANSEIFFTAAEIGNECVENHNK